METLVFALAGFISGAHSSFWGAYKDCLHEKFKVIKLIRSWIVGSVLGIIFMYIFRLGKIDSPNMGVFIAFVVIYERLYTETWKAFLRNEDQEKYQIPSQVHVLGKVVQSGHLRVLIGIIFLIYIALSVFLPAIFPLKFESKLLTGAFWGCIAGLLGSALLGAAKDAPIEGFYPFKFLRSIIIGACWGAIFSFFTDNYVFLASASVGAERMTVELYKTFWLRSTPGKFKFSNGLSDFWRQRRKAFIIPYAVTWVIFLLLLFK